MLRASQVIARPALNANVLIAGALLVVAIGVFWGALSEMVSRWIRQDEYGHAFFIPLITVWLLWTRRGALSASIDQPTWIGPLILSVSILMHLVGELSALFVLSQLGFIVALCGLVVSAGGVSLLRAMFVPLAFLAFAIPLPYFIDSVLTWRLQLISTDLGVLVIRMFQLPVYQEGNIIDLGTYKLQVVEACSGLRYLYPLMSLGFLGAYFFQAPLWQRAIVFLSTIPITIGMNSLRIGIVGVLVNKWGTQMADGALHFFEGWVIFICCALLLLGEMTLLAKFGARRSFNDVFAIPTLMAPGSVSDKLRSRLVNFAPIASAVILIAGGLAVLHLSSREEIIPERQRFVEFPRNLGSWQGKPMLLEAEVEQGLKMDDYVLADYRVDNSAAVNLYVAYYSTQRKGNSPHSPTVCMPGGGWLITSFDRKDVSGDTADFAFPVNRAVIERGAAKQVVYYWFVQRGRKVANEYWSKWHLFVDAIVKNRTDGALVRVTSPIVPGETDIASDARIKSFIRELGPRLGPFVSSLNEPLPVT